MKYYCIRESLPLGEMGDWLGLSFSSKSERDQVFSIWAATYAAGRCVGVPVKEDTSYPIGHLVSDVGYWMKRLS